MEVALRRRLGGVAGISISQQEQRAIATFLPGTTAFSAAAFRDAVGEADVEVLAIEAHVCGVVDSTGRLLSAGRDQEPLVELRGEMPPGTSICVTGHLNDRTQPDTLEVVSAQPRP
jgi:hypothetical protein